MIKLRSIIVVVSVAFLAWSCTHPAENATANNQNNNTGGNNNTNTTDKSCNPDSVYFANDILPIVQSNCAKSGCHDSKSHREGVNLSDYKNIKRYVNAGNPNRSTLFSIIGRGMPPYYEQQVSSTQKQAIGDWISQGAKNNSCTDACDTTNYGFKDVIQPILTKYCGGCHGASSGSAGVKMIGYDNVVVYADDYSLLNAIQRVPGRLPMPPDNALPDCEVKLIELWINAGTPNN
ncbi:hypothetical protein GC194_11765 [bacterium]|nr:hypothetical protein [bacterium]